MKINRKFASIAAVAALALSAAACTSSSNAGTNVEQNQQNGQLTQYTKSQPIPYFQWSLERQILIDAEVASAQGDQSTSFFFNFGVQDPILVCTSLGMAVPDNAQLSNPEQVVGNRQNKVLPQGDWTTLPQMEPFGIHVSPSSVGTYAICIVNGKPVLQRAEETVHTVMAPATWDYAKHRIVEVGNPSTDVTTHPPLPRSKSLSWSAAGTSLTAGARGRALPYQFSFGDLSDNRRTDQ